jgi:hypothetical protein
LEKRVKGLNLNQNILENNRDDLLHVVNVLKFKTNELLSVIRSKNEKISDLEERNTNLEQYGNEKDKWIEYLEKRKEKLEKDIIPSIWEKVAEGNDLNAQKKVMYFAKCEKNKALKTKIGGLNEKMEKMNKELRCKDYQIEGLNESINEIIFEKNAVTDNCLKKISNLNSEITETGNLCDWIKNASLNEIQEVKKQTQTLSKQNARKFILFKRKEFLQRLAPPQGGHSHMGKTKEESNVSHAHAQFLHRLAPPQGGHAQKRKVGRHAQREAPSLEGALLHVGASSRDGALAQGGHSLKGKYESHAQRGHAHKGKDESQAPRDHAQKVSHVQIEALPAGSRLWVWLEGRALAQLSHAQNGAPAEEGHAQIGAPAQGDHAHKDKDKEGLDTVAMFTIPVEAVEWYWSTEKEFLEKILAGNLDSFYKIK